MPRRNRGIIGTGEGIRKSFRHTTPRRTNPRIEVQLRARPRRNSSSSESEALQGGGLLAKDRDNPDKTLIPEVDPFFTPRSSPEVDTTVEIPGARPRAVPVEERPGQCRGFRICRIIRYTNKSGLLRASPGGFASNPEFQWAYGDFVLNLSKKTAMICNVRNYAGQEGILPRRMLQEIYLPWRIPTNIELVHEDGIPFPLRWVNRDLNQAEGHGTSFVNNEAVMLTLKPRDAMPSFENNRFHRLVDYEENSGTIHRYFLDRRHDRPWGLLVKRTAFERRYRNLAVPKWDQVDVLRPTDEEDAEPHYEVR